MWCEQNVVKMLNGGIIFLKLANVKDIVCLTGQIKCSITASC